MSGNDWSEAPAQSGLYWAYAEGRCNNGPSICKVNLLAPGRWTVTFLSNVQTYNFRKGQGWLWMPVERPETPVRKE